MTIRSVCVFCGSSPGSDPAFVDLGRAVGRGLAERGITLVYGAGGAGVMGAVADGALAAGGEVVGVIPEFMVEREWGRADLTEVHVVESMHQRKALMAERSDAFLALPGGLGTLEELFEAWTWRQIGISERPLGLLDVGGFWSPLVTALQGLVDAGFVSQASLDDLVVTDSLDAALTALDSRGPGGVHLHQRNQ